MELGKEAVGFIDELERKGRENSQRLRLVGQIMEAIFRRRDIKSLEELDRRLRLVRDILTAVRVEADPYSCFSNFETVVRFSNPGVLMSPNERGAEDRAQAAAPDDIPL